jgi:hypothetical protein
MPSFTISIRIIELTIRYLNSRMKIKSYNLNIKSVKYSPVLFLIPYSTQSITQLIFVFSTSFLLFIFIFNLFI